LDRKKELGMTFWIGKKTRDDILDRKKELGMKVWIGKRK